MRRLSSCVVILATAFISPAQDIGPVLRPLEPKLEYSKSLASGIEFLGKIGRVTVLRWEGGIPVGWVEIVEDGKPRKIEVDVERRVEFLANSKPWDARMCSGWLLIAVRPFAKGAKTREVFVSLTVEQTFLIDKHVRMPSSTSQWQGLVPTPKDDFDLGGAMVTDPGKSIKTWVDYKTSDERDYMLFDLELKVPMQKK
jgi:hypothetical protein